LFVHILYGIGEKEKLLDMLDKSVTAFLLNQNFIFVMIKEKRNQNFISVKKKIK